MNETNAKPPLIAETGRFALKGSSVDITVSLFFSGLHLNSAYAHEKMVQDLDANGSWQHASHLAAATACILSATSAFEAFINEAYAFVVHPRAFGRRALHLPEARRDELKKKWEDFDARNAPTRKRASYFVRKCDMAIDWKKQPWSDFEKLQHLRNSLVHAYPQSSGHTWKKHKELEDELATIFPERYAVSMRWHSSMRLVPYALGLGSCAWAIQTVRECAADFLAKTTLSPWGAARSTDIDPADQQDQPKGQPK